MRIQTERPRFHPIGFSLTGIAMIGLLCAPAIRPQSLAAQSPKQTARVTFDAASVKLASAPEEVTVQGDLIEVPRSDIQRLKHTGGPGTNDPGRIHYPLVSLKQLLNLAWEDSWSEIKGPEWLDTRTVALDATMPSDTTPDQFREMLRNLLIDRFKLKYHVQTKAAASGYYLVLPNSDQNKAPVEIKMLPAGTMIIDHIEKTPTDN
jgi:hypothetical protein